MDLINRYFNDLVFYKVDQRENYTIYAANISSAAMVDSKLSYILVFVPNYLATMNKAYLRELPWHNLQTRRMQNPYQLPRQKWEVPRDAPDVFFHLVKREKNATTYVPEQPIPFELLLLHDPKKQSIYQHYGRVGLIGALNTFHTVLNFTGEVEKIDQPRDEFQGVTPLTADGEKAIKPQPPDRYQSLATHSSRGPPQSQMGQTVMPRPPSAHPSPPPGFSNGNLTSGYPPRASSGRGPSSNHGYPFGQKPSGSRSQAYAQSQALPSRPPRDGVQVESDESSIFDVARPTTACKSRIVAGYRIYPTSRIGHTIVLIGRC